MWKEACRMPPRGYQCCVQTKCFSLHWGFWCVTTTDRSVVWGSGKIKGSRVQILKALFSGFDQAECSDNNVGVLGRKHTLRLLWVSEWESPSGNWMGTSGVWVSSAAAPAVQICHCGQWLPLRGRIGVGVWWMAMATCTRVVGANGPYQGDSVPLSVVPTGKGLSDTSSVLS